MLYVKKSKKGTNRRTNQRTNKVCMQLKTRPDTRPSVADGWAGAEMQLSTTKNVLKRSFLHFLTRVHGPTDQPTNQRMDKASYRVACPQLETIFCLV